MRFVPITLILLLSIFSATLQAHSQTTESKKPIANDSAANHAGNESGSHEQKKLNTARPTSGVIGQPKGQPKEEDHGAQPSNGIYRVEVVSQPRDVLYLIYVGLTALTLVVLVGTLLMIYRQTGVFRRAERAWMVGKSEITPFKVNEKVFYPATFTNVGKSPAKVIEAGVSLKKIGSLSHISLQPKYEPNEVLSFNEMLVAPTDSFDLTAPEIGMTESEYKSLNLSPPTLFLYAHGFVKYVDAFGVKHETRFCESYYISGSTGPTVEGFQRYLMAPREYNKAT
jgi:hypothetical protein